MVKAELINGQYDGKVVDVPHPPPPELVLADLASYGEFTSYEAKETEPMPVADEMRTLIYRRQYRRVGSMGLKKVVYVYEA